MVQVPKELWDRIIEALESASLCDHDLVPQVLKEIETLDSPGRKQ
jgi:hypothetical protein